MWEGASIMKAKSLGRYIVADPAICHGRPTFRGTRVLVADILNQVARGMAREAIPAEWPRSLSKKAIAEAVRLTRVVRRLPGVGKARTRWAD